MKKTALFRALAAGLALAAAAGAAHAHQIWFEQDAGKITFRYGELDENLHEVSPGGLDRFGRLEASWLKARGAEALAMAKQQDGYAVPVKAAAGESFVAIDKAYPMFDTKRGDTLLRTWWVPATRWVADFSAQKAVLPMDIVPTGVTQGDAAEFQLIYKGEPLAGEKVKVATPAGWVRFITSDADGKVMVALPWRGNYTVGVYFVDDIEGVRGEEKYQLEGYNTSLSFHVAKGVAPFAVTTKTLPASVLAEQRKAAAGK